ncbi:hypothetical protein NPIL_575781 [Nephila pilipes]|uniref:Uncharacterized protein n=1 Tax=Nephila pilipes TaxID=299642 RepID=A0A8X6QKC6_NEPPI|nr:hypothetical protein NPIL_575781 [Nephila pilipes]
MQRSSANLCSLQSSCPRGRQFGRRLFHSFLPPSSLRRRLSDGISRSLVPRRIISIDDDELGDTDDDDALERVM